MMNEENLNENLGYRQHPAIANSDLKYLYSPKIFKSYKDGTLESSSPSKYQSLGTIFEDFLNLTEEQFDNKYVVEPDCEKPNSPNKLGFAEYVASGANLLEAYCENYKVSDKALKNGEALQKAEDLYGDLKPYITFIAESEEKIPIKIEEYSKIIAMKGSLESDPVYQDMMNSEQKEVIISLQLGVGSTLPKATFWGVDWKGEIDYLILDHRKKIAYLIDLKTTGKPIAWFHYEAKKYKYYRQLALYRKLVEEYLKSRGKEDWTIYTRFFAVETFGIFESAVIPIPYNMLKIGEEELIEAADTISWYRENGWMRYRSQVNNEGLFLLDWASLGIYVEEEEDDSDN